MWEAATTQKRLRFQNLDAWRMCAPVEAAQSPAVAGP